MEKLLSAQGFFYLVTFVVPGFVLYTALQAFLPAKEEPAQISFLRVVSLSCWNIAAWSGLLYVMIGTDLLTGHPILQALSWFWVLLVGPTVLGVVFGSLRKTGAVERVLSAMGLDPLDLLHTAWDAKFNRTGSSWVMITLTDGSEVAGKYWTNSRASDDAKHRDIYVEEVWSVDDEGIWSQVDRTDGIWIPSEQIKYIEFWKELSAGDTSGTKDRESV
jgi:hypothetical protein